MNDHPIPKKIQICVVKQLPDTDISDIQSVWNSLFDNNTNIINYFELLITETNASKEPNWRFKIKAYTTVVKTVKEFTVPIVSSKQLQGIPGIGPKSLKKIQEIIETQHLVRIDTGEKEKYQVLKLFTSIWGISQNRALEFYNLGYRTIQDLINHSTTLRHQEIIGLQYRNDLSQRIPRDVLEDMQVRYEAILKHLEPSSRLEIVGSFRRGAVTSGDVDIIITSDITPSVLLKKFVLYGKEYRTGSEKSSRMIVDDVSWGDTKYIGVVMDPIYHINRKLNIWSVPRISWACARVAFTGPPRFNIMLRKYARDRGNKVSEHNIENLDTKEKLYPKTEQEFFDILGIPYIPPNQREKTIFK